MQGWKGDIEGRKYMEVASAWGKSIRRTRGPKVGSLAQQLPVVPYQESLVVEQLLGQVTLYY